MIKMNTILSQFSFTRYVAIFSLVLGTMLGSANAQDLNTQMSKANKARIGAGHPAV